MRAVLVLAALGMAAPLAAQTSPPAVQSGPAAAAPATPKAPAAKGAVTGVTPNAQRDVTIGAINKRTGETRAFVGHPGDSFDFGSLHVVVRTCETTPPWEQRLTGAFLLIDEKLLRGAPKRVFSGWMFAESPSLHPLEHPRYDIWVKSCTMRFPETGPDTVSAGREGSAGARSPAKPSIAKKSAETPSAPDN
ncbi:MAG: DUF2155 domain-containing protein [Alphaproteobacteria bacterium]|nr:MAG: DUF2155 domain-containing protein [Alphaproteobacteria bacterium]